MIDHTRSNYDLGHHCHNEEASLHSNQHGVFLTPDSDSDEIRPGVVLGEYLLVQCQVLIQCQEQCKEEQ